MKKELKELIKKLNLSDDQIMELLNKTPEGDKDIKDESEDSADSNEQNNAEEKPAVKETSKGADMVAMQKLIDAAVAKAMALKKPLTPAQKPITITEEPAPKPKAKPLPKATHKDDFTNDIFWN